MSRGRDVKNDDDSAATLLKPDAREDLQQIQRNSVRVESKDKDVSRETGRSSES